MGKFADAVGTRNERYEAQGTVPVYAPQPILYTPQYPTAPFDMEINPEEMYGVPEDWDYRTATLGPNNEELPTGAIGWTPWGDAWYGDGIAGWWNGTYNRLFNPDKETLAIEHLYNSTQKAQNAIDVWSNPDMNIWQKGVASIGSGLGAIGDLFAAGGTPDSTPDEERGVFDVAADVTSLGLRFISESVRTGLAVFQVAAEGTEQVLFGLPAGIQEVAEEGPISANWDIPDISVDLPFNMDTWFPNFLEGVLDATFAMPINLFGAAIAPISGKEKLDIVSANFQAGRIAYSNMIDPMLREQYMKRWRDGESAVLLAMELGDPGAELVGELIFDPLNFIGKFAKAARFNKWKDGAYASVAKIEPGFGLQDAVKAGEAVDDIQGADDIVDVVNSLQTRSLSTVERQADFARAEGLGTLTQDARRAALLENGGVVMKHVFANSRNTNEAIMLDRALDTLEGLAKVMSGDREIVAQGYAALRNSDTPMEVLLSKSAGDLGQILLNTFWDGEKMNVAGFSKLVEKAVALGDEAADLAKAGDAAATEKFLEGLDTADAARYRELLSEAESFSDIEGARRYIQTSEMWGILSKRIDPTINKMIPTIAERAAAGEKLRRSTRMFGAFETWKQSKGVRFIDTFFANVYMGLSPGYVARNLMVDRLTMFLDIGGAAKTRKAFGRLHDTDYLLGKSAEMLGGFLPDIAKQGIGQIGVAELKRVMPGLKAAANVEKKSSAALFYHYVADTMEKMISFGDGGTIDLAKVVAAGGQPDLVKAIPRLVLANNYDAAKAIGELRQMVSTGSIDAFRTMTWVSDETRKGLQAYSLWDDFQDGLKGAESLEDAMKVLDDTKALYGDLADASRVGTSLPPKDARVIANMQATKVPPDEMLSARQAQRGANILAENTLRRTMEDMLDLAKQLAPDKITDDLVTRFKASIADYTMGKDALTLRSEQIWDKIGDVKTANHAKLWDMHGLPGVAPDSRLVSEQILRDWLFMDFWGKQAADGTLLRNATLGAMRDVMDELRGIVKITDERKLSRINDLFEQAAKMDGAVVFDGALTDIGVASNVHLDDLRRLGAVNEVRLAKGDAHALNIAKKYAKGAGVTLPDDFRHIGQIEYEDWAKILDHRAGVSEGKVFRALDDATEGAKKVESLEDKLHHPHLDTDALAAPGQAYRAGEKHVDTIFKQLEAGIQRNFGRTEEVVSNPRLAQALDDLEADLVSKISEARITAAEVGAEGRNFSLHNYGKRYNFDTVASVIYPFHFWHTRTYANWAKRIATNPGVIAGYAKYKEALAQIHANAPEWWRYNVNSAEMLGLFKDNPAFFNLESTLNPLYGLVGVDFNDRYKRINGLTSFVDDLSKFGPSTWTPISLAMALSLKQQGEDDAASRWGGRLVPQTKVLDSILSILHHPEGAESIEPGDAHFRFDSIDPALAIFSNGIDPYERRRVGYALAAMVDEGIVTEDQATDAAQAQKGEIWEAAIERAVRQRAPGQIASSLFGIGFKARTQMDLQIERFDQERFALMNNRQNLSPEEYRREWSILKQKFPFADLVMMSRKSGYERDVAFTYDVLGRLPPGGKEDIYKAAGLNPEQVSEFYESKGDSIETWTENERESFLDAILNMSAVLATPDDATKAEWDVAKQQYAQYNGMIEKIYGEDIHDKINMYFELRQQSYDASDAFMEAHPEVGKALDLKSAAVAGDPTSPFATYYGSLSNIEGFYKGSMYAEIDQKLGEEIWDVLETYWGLPSKSSARRAYKRLHPEINQYYDIRDKWDNFINRKAIEIGSMFQPERGVALRSDTSLSFAQQAFVNQLNSRTSLDDVEAGEWQELIGPDYQHVTNWVFGKVEVPWEVRQRLEAISDELDISFNRLLQLIGISLQ